LIAEEAEAASVFDTVASATDDFKIGIQITITVKAGDANAFAIDPAAIISLGF
jgi:hypothetical protein